MKRIRSTEGSFGGDLRLQLGAVINEFKVFGTLKDIPVVTASQLNRVATSSVDTARVRSKSDLVRLIGRSNVGESNLILENSDWISLIAPEKDQVTGDRYLGMNRVKSRYKIADESATIFIPFNKGTIKFIEDIGLPQPMHRTTMKGPEELTLNNGVSKVAGSINTVSVPQDTSFAGAAVAGVDNNIFSESVQMSASKSLDLYSIRTSYPSYMTTVYYNATKPERLMYDIVDYDK